MSDYDVWYRCKKRFEQDGANFTLQGHAVSARASGFWIPEFQVMFDAGICSPFNPLHIFVTHSHSDHAFNLPIILTGITTKPFVYVPRGAGAVVRAFLLAKHQLSRCDANAVYNVDEHCTLVEVSDGDAIPITVRGDQPMLVRVFATDHKIASVGYALFHVRSRLKPEYAACKGPELAQKRKDGVPLQMQVFAPCCVYVGDSTPRWMSHDLFKNNDWPVVLCECTFVGELEDDPQRAVDAAAEHGHTCWAQLGPLIKQRVDAGAKTTYCLVHWSDRYTSEAIVKFFKDVKQVFAWTN